MIQCLGFHSPGYVMELNNKGNGSNSDKSSEDERGVAPQVGETGSNTDTSVGLLRTVSYGFSYGFLLFFNFFTALLGSLGVLRARPIDGVPERDRADPKKGGATRKKKRRKRGKSRVVNHKEDHLVSSGESSVDSKEDHLVGPGESSVDSKDGKDASASAGHGVVLTLEEPKAQETETHDPNLGRVDIPGFAENGSDARVNRAAYPAYPVYSVKTSGYFGRLRVRETRKWDDLGIRRREYSGGTGDEGVPEGRREYSGGTGGEGVLEGRRGYSGRRECSGGTGDEGVPEGRREYSGGTGDEGVPEGRREYSGGTGGEGVLGCSRGGSYPCMDGYFSSVLVCQGMSSSAEDLAKCYNKNRGTDRTTLSKEDVKGISQFRKSGIEGQIRSILNKPVHISRYYILALDAKGLGSIFRSCSNNQVVTVINKFLPIIRGDSLKEARDRIVNAFVSMEDGYFKKYFDLAFYGEALEYEEWNNIADEIFTLRGKCGKSTDCTYKEELDADRKGPGADKKKIKCHNRGCFSDRDKHLVKGLDYDNPPRHQLSTSAVCRDNTDLENTPVVDMDKEWPMDW